MKVSIVVPVFNVESFISRCLNSIIQQTLSDIEIIVVNDGTPDNSMIIAEELANDDDRIRIIDDKINRGPMCAREIGYKAATGDYITFCDSDDYLPQDALENLYKKAIETGADIVSGNYTYVTSSGKNVLKRNKLPYGNKPVDVYKALLCNDMQHSLWGKLFRRSLLQDYNYQTYEHATNGEDGCLLYQIVKHVNEVVQIDKSVYCYVQNTGSSSQRRYNENAIRSMCLTNSVIVNSVFAFPVLQKQLNRRITNSLCKLFAEGYGKDFNLWKHISQNRLQRFVSIGYIIRYLNYMNAAKIVIKRVVRKGL